MNESCFLFVLDMIVLDEGRRTYSLYRMCVLSLIIVLALLALKHQQRNEMCACMMQVHVHVSTILMQLYNSISG